MSAHPRAPSRVRTRYRVAAWLGPGPCPRAAPGREMRPREGALPTAAIGVPLRPPARSARSRLDAPKSGDGVRQIPISKRLAADLALHRDGASDEHPVFAGPEGRALREEFVLRSIVTPAAWAAGVPRAGAHTLRHTCASILFRSGWNAKQVQVVLGHHSLAFTLATYVHPIPDDLPEPLFLHERAGRGSRRGAPLHGRGIVGPAHEMGLELGPGNQGARPSLILQVADAAALDVEDSTGVAPAGVAGARDGARDPRGGGSPAGGVAPRSIA